MLDKTRLRIIRQTNQPKANSKSEKNTVTSVVFDGLLRMYPVMHRGLRQSAIMDFGIANNYSYVLEVYRKYGTQEQDIVQFVKTGGTNSVEYTKFGTVDYIMQGSMKLGSEADIIDYCFIKSTHKG